MMTPDEISKILLSIPTGDLIYFDYKTIKFDQKVKVGMEIPIYSKNFHNGILDLVQLGHNGSAGVLFQYTHETNVFFNPGLPEFKEPGWFYSRHPSLPVVFVKKSVYNL